MHLSAMMGLVIEKMRDQHPHWFGDIRLKSTGEPGEIAGEPFVVQAGRPIDYGLVHFCSRGFEVGPVTTFFDRPCEIRLCRFRGSGIPAHPHSVTPEDVIERAMD